MLWFALQYLSCPFKASFGQLVSELCWGCLSPCHVIKVLRSSCLWDSQAAPQKQISVLKACNWTGNPKYLGFSFSGIWSAVGSWNYLKINLFCLLKSRFKIEAASSPPGSKKNNLRMSLHGRAHLLWNFSHLNWGIFELGLQWKQFLKGKKLWWNVPHSNSSVRRHGFCPHPCHRLLCDCWQTTHGLIFFFFFCFFLFLNQSCKITFMKAMGGCWRLLAWCKLLPFPCLFPTSVLGDMMVVFHLCQMLSA